MTRAVKTPTLVLVVLAVALSCGRKKPARRARKPDGGVTTKPPDATAPRVRRQPRALPRLLAHVPRRATWFVGVARPAVLLTGVARIVDLLADIPDLAAPLARVKKEGGALLGGWPPAVARWQAVGIDPGGGVVVAGVPADAQGRGEGTLVVVQSAAPQRLLRHLVKSPSAVTTWTRARFDDGQPWWCGPLAVGVACATSQALLTEAAAGALARPQRAVVGAIPTQQWTTVDLVGGVRAGAGQPLSAAVLRFVPGGGRATVWLRHGELRGWLSWLAPAVRPPPAASQALARAWVRLDSARVSTLLGLVPKDLVQSRGVAPATLLAQCTGEASLTVDAQGWRLWLSRRGPAGPAEPRRWVVSGWSMWAYAPAGALILGPSPAATRAPVPKATSGPLPPPLSALPRRSAARVHAVLTDPLEWLSAADRVRVLAALVGLAAGERAFVGLVRGLLTLVGETVVTAEAGRTLAVVRLAFRSPLADRTAPRRAFVRLWRAKWQGGGYFHRRRLAKEAPRHPASALQRMARALAGMALSDAASRAITDWLLGLLASLKGPELSCATLSARLTGCLEPFARRRTPQRWKELDAAMLGAHRRMLRQDLLEVARREAKALGAHCDRLAGRLENAAAVSACLKVDGCDRFTACLLRAFTPQAAAR